jgi:hypothetical protein
VNAFELVTQHGILSLKATRRADPRRYTAAIFLANQGGPVRVDYRYAIMHDKFNGETVE